MFSILDRSTISETWQTLVIGIVLVAGVFFATAEFQKIMTLICDLGIESNTAILITCLQLPNTVVFCLPAGMLLATGLVLWRKTFDYEILALSVAGADTLRIIRPFIVLSIAAATVSFILSDSIVPESRRIANKLFFTGALNSNLPKSEACLTFMQYDQTSQDARLKQILVAGKNMDRELKNVVIFDMSHSKVPKVIWAKTGTWCRGQWQLQDGYIYELFSAEARRINSHFQRFTVDAIGRFMDKVESRGPLPTELTTRELRNEIQKYESQGKPVPNVVMIRYLRRFSQPISCLFLAFAALPFCVATPRKRSYLPLAYIGIVVTVYFIVQQICLSLGDNSRLSPEIAAWAPGLLPLIIGLIAYFIAKARR